MKKMVIFFSVLVLVVGLSASGQAALVDMHDGTIYDTNTQLSWLKDAGAGGAKNWVAANAWAASLNAGSGFAGFTDWRLPATLQPDASCSDQLIPGGGFPLQGWNYNCVNSELGQLFYISLGNTAGALTNTGLFTNLQADSYWSGTSYAPSPILANGEWYFYFSNGFQYVSDCGIFSAWAVRSGERTVPSASPVGYNPQWLIITLVSLMGAGGILLRRRTI